jgi:predicted nucleic acid-binding protein
MTALYLETSALLAWLFGESGAGDVRAAVDAAEVVTTSSLTFTEADRALVRSEHAGGLKAAQAQTLRGLVQRARGGWMVMAVTEDVLERAGRVFPVEPIRTLDAVHLATALAFVPAFPDLKILSIDRRILANAGALGIA